MFAETEELHLIEKQSTIEFLQYKADLPQIKKGQNNFQEKKIHKIN